jgi:hypothetical protein
LGKGFFEHLREIFARRGGGLGGGGHELSSIAVDAGFRCWRFERKSRRSRGPSAITGEPHHAGGSIRLRTGGSAP